MQQTIWHQLQKWGAPTDNELTAINLFAAVNRVESGLLLEYRLIDPQNLVERPPSLNNQTIQRCHELWQTTCFEAFWSEPQQENYWELNLSPNYAYNIYSFHSYRQPQPPQQDLQFAVTKIQQQKDIWRAWVEGPFSKAPLYFNLCAILKLRHPIKGQADTLFMSSQHVGTKPDFHARPGFNIIIDSNEAG